MAQYVEEVIRRIKTESMRVCNISRHITASVIAFSTAPPVELKQISDAGNGLYFPTHLTEDGDSGDDIPNAFAKFFGFATTVAAKDIHLSIIADPQVNILCMTGIKGFIFIVHSNFLPGHSRSDGTVSWNFPGIRNTQVPVRFHSI